MNQTQSNQNNINLPPRMKAALEQYKKRVWIIKLAEGTLAALFGLIISYLVVFGLDRLFDTHALIRALILIMGMVGIVVFLPLKYYKWVWRHRRLEGLARLLQHKFPRFGDHVLGIIELASERTGTSSSPALVAAAMRQVDEEVTKHNFAEAVPNPRHRRWAFAAGIPLVIAIIGVLIIPATSRNALARWLTPWREVERYTFAQLDGKNDNLVVAYAEPFNVETHLKDDSPWKPESGHAQYADQTPIVTERQGTAYNFELPPQTEDGSLNMRVGDARRSIPIQPKIRPALKELIAKVQLPEYLQLPELQIQDVRGGIVNIVNGSTATLEATITRELSEAKLNNRPQQVVGARMITESIAADKTKDISLTWRDQYGLTATEPQVLQFEVEDDAVPMVTLTKLKNNQVVLSTEVLTFEIQAEDDFGVKLIGLEWEGIENPIHNPQPDIGEKTVSAGTPSSDSLTVPATFSIQRENIRPQTFRLRAYAEDYFPNRKRVHSSQIVLHILEPTEHFKWVMGQMQLWAGAARDVHDKELQLFQTNLELRDLTPEELDNPAQRKTLQNQAAAERANAIRLDSLIGSGIELLQEATKNDEFDPDQLDTWADVLEKLEDIAGKKMPSVADLLAQAAEAPGMPSGQNTQEGSQPNTSPPSPNSPPSQGQSQSGEQNSDSRDDIKKYGPDDKILPENPEQTDENPDDPNKSGDSATVDRSKPPEATGKPAATPNNPAPSVGDVESGFNKPEKPVEGPPMQMVGGLGLATTSLKGSGRDEQEQEQDTENSEVSDFVIEAVDVQQELLDAFGKLSDEMKKLLAGLENSTFVKRLKAASRKQIDISVDLNKLDAFGLANRATNNQIQRNQIAQIEEAQAKIVTTIIQDMSAYTDRRPNAAYLRVLAEMENATVAAEMRNLITTINRNLIGLSTIEAEYWGDTLDRWAEQLVGPLPPSRPGEGGMMELPNLPPEIILKVLRVINREMQLREETREVEQARNALTEDEYYLRSEPLSDTQYDLAEQTREIAREINQLPDANTQFVQEQYLKVSTAADVMDETESILATPETGPKAIAAISEVIEILLETRRTPNTPPAGNAPPAIANAIMLMGSGDDKGQAFIEKRSPQQATGRAGRVLPEEFRQGLDAYFNVLEGN